MGTRSATSLERLAQSRIRPRIFCPSEPQGTGFSVRGLVNQPRALAPRRNDRQFPDPKRTFLASREALSYLLGRICPGESAISNFIFECSSIK
jgi:hypothetical protein